MRNFAHKSLVTSNLKKKVAEMTKKKLVSDKTIFLCIALRKLQTIGAKNRQNGISMEKKSHIFNDVTPLAAH